MSINLTVPTNETPDLKPHITVIGVGGAGGNAVNNMIESELLGVDFVVANTDAQALTQSSADRRIQLGAELTKGLGAGARAEVGQAAAEEAMDDILAQIGGANMTFIAAGMGGGTGTGAAPVIARAAKEKGILTVGVVTKPFQFEGAHRMQIADAGIKELEKYVDTLIIIPNQNLFRIANEKTTFADAFKMADDVLHSGVRGVTDLMVMPGLINLDFADVKSVMSEMGKAMMGTGEADGERRALDAAEAAISNPLLDDTSMKGANGVLINITGGPDMTLFEVDEAANRIRAEVDQDAYIIFGSTFNEELSGKVRVSVVATGIDAATVAMPAPALLAENPASTRNPLAQAPAAPEPEAETEPAAEPDQQPESIQLLDRPAAATAAELRTPDTKTPEKADNADTSPSPEPAMGALSAFIPPKPMETTDTPIEKPADPFAEADMINVAKAPGKSAKKKGLSLFERVTGGNGQPGAVTQEGAESPASEPTAAATAPSLGGFDTDDRPAPPRAEEDLLDIPSFLRRQAN